MKWYKVSQYGSPEITTVEVVKETAKFVTYIHVGWDGKSDERREAKGDEYFPTFMEARTALLNRFQRKMDNYKRDYEFSKKCWDTIFLMEEPK